MDVDLNMIRYTLGKADEEIARLRLGFGFNDRPRSSVQNLISMTLLHLRMADLAAAIDQTNDEIGLPRDSSLT